MFGRSRSSPKPVEIDLWEGVGMQQIGGYIVELDEVASELSKMRGREIMARFNANPSLMCAELVTINQEVIARVVVLGRMGPASEAVVSPDSLSRKERLLFIDALDPLLVTFKESIR